MGKALGKSLGSLFVGVDISKEKFDVCCISRKGETLFRITASMDIGGFDTFLSNLQSLSVAKDRILIGMESTACYHINLFSYLSAQGYAVHIINPLLIANFVKLQLRKTKTDKKDALVIAQFLVLNREHLSKRAVSSDVTDLRDLARQRESLVRQMTAIKAEIGNALTITFPELERITGIFTKSVLSLLCRYPSAKALREAKRSAIARILISKSHGRHSTEMVDTIMKAAGESIGTTSLSKEIVIRQEATILVQYEEHLKEITDLLIEHCQGTMLEDREILTSVKGIGDQMATSFLIEMGGTISHFPTHKQLIAMAGIDPTVYQSGKYTGQSRLSKRGNTHLRRLIWLMTRSAIQFNAYFREYHQKRMKEGLPYKKAVMATAHKLMRVLYAMLTNRTMFNTAMNSR